MLEEPDIVAMEIMDTNQLTSNIQEAMEGGPLTVSILQNWTKPHAWKNAVGRIMVCYRSCLQRAVLIMESHGLEGGDIS